jgi:hypothetical protein
MYIIFAVLTKNDNCEILWNVGCDKPLSCDAQQANADARLGFDRRSRCYGRKGGFYARSEWVVIFCVTKFNYPITRNADIQIRKFQGIKSKVIGLTSRRGDVGDDPAYTIRQKFDVFIREDFHSAKIALTKFEWWN